MNLQIANATWRAVRDRLRAGFAWGVSVRMIELAKTVVYYHNRFARFETGLQFSAALFHID
jgi:hypothetical protein